MLTTFASNCRKGAIGATFALVAIMAVPAAGQTIEAIDPDMAIDADLAQPARTQAPATSTGSSWQVDQPARYEEPAIEAPSARYADQAAEVASAGPVETYPAPAAADAARQAQAQTQPAIARSGNTYAEDDLIGAAEGLFGRGAEGLARMLEDILDKQGEPNGYIVGREGGGAFVLGVRYGSGTLFHKIEGNMPVYWTGPSIGLDAGANAGNTFVLVYNLDDTDELYERYPSGEGQAYLVGGFNASYMRKGNVVLIPIRVGAGLRLGLNAGYMRFSREQRWLPF